MKQNKTKKLKSNKTITNPSKKKVYNNKTKLKKYKTFTNITKSVDKIHILKNNYFFFITSYGYNVYNDKFKLIKFKQFDNDINSVTNIKIIDNDNFMCLIDWEKLTKINIKSGKLITLFVFKETIEHIIYYKKNKIITSSEYGEHIKIWELLNNGRYQLVTIYNNNLSSYKIYLIIKKNLLVFRNLLNNNNYSINFLNLKNYKIENKFEYEWNDNHFCQMSDDIFLFGMHILNEDGLYPSNEIIKYNIKNKKIELKKKFDFFYNHIDFIQKKGILLISGCKPNSNLYLYDLYNQIYVYNSNLEKLQIIELSSSKKITGFTFYQKDEKELLFYFLFNHCEGNIEILSFC